jgi:hypothetical protein
VSGKALASGFSAARELEASFLNGSKNERYPYAKRHPKTPKKHHLTSQEKRHYAQPFFCRAMPKQHMPHAVVDGTLDRNPKR